MLNDFLIYNFIHYLKPFNWLLLHDSDVLLFQRNRSERIVKIEQALVQIDSQEFSNVSVVGQGCTKPDKTNVFLCGFDVANYPSIESNRIELKE